MASGPEGMGPLVEPTLQRWFTAGFAERNPETAEWIRGMIRATDPAGFRGCCAALMELDLTARLADVHVSSLVLVGADDPTTPPSGAQVIRDYLPDARLEVMPQAAHLSNVEQPDLFNRHLVSFLATQSGADPR